MIVVSIIGILSSIAIPAYQHYLRRARFTELIATTEMYKTAVALALQEGLTANEINTNTEGIPKFTPTKHIAEITVEQATITAVATSLLNHMTYILSPNENGTLWRVSGTCKKYGLCS